MTIITGLSLYTMWIDFYILSTLRNCANIFRT